MKIKECTNCGCKRRILVEAKVFFQEDNLCISTHRSCLNCFLDFLKVVDLDGKINKEITMGVLSEAVTSG